MALSFRGKNVDISSLARKYGSNIALGNAHMNGRGDRLGKGGKVIETREEMLKKYYNANTKKQAQVNLKDENLDKEIEKELKEISAESLIESQSLKVAKPSEPKVEKPSKTEKQKKAKEIDEVIYDDEVVE